MLQVKKKPLDIVIVLIGIVLVLSLISCGFFAYFTYQKSLMNTITVGSQVSKIEEEWTPPEEIVQDNDYTKKVSVKNTGTVDCYVRVFAEFETPEMSQAIDVNFDSANWTGKQSDGYYYYNKILKSGESTEPLFTTLHANKDLDDLTLIVYEETIQADGFDNAKAAFAAVQ